MVWIDSHEWVVIRRLQFNPSLSYSEWWCPSVPPNSVCVCVRCMSLSFESKKIHWAKETLVCPGNKHITFVCICASVWVCVQYFHFSTQLNIYGWFWSDDLDRPLLHQHHRNTKRDLENICRRGLRLFWRFEMEEHLTKKQYVTFSFHLSTVWIYKMCVFIHKSVCVW